jgi:hypothetical protein
MKIEIDLPDIEGYEYTSEYRLPLKGEEVAIDHMHTKVGCSDCSVKYFILKKKEPKYSVKTHHIKGVDIKHYEAKALEDAIAIIDSHYNWAADLRAATLELKELIK